MEIRSPQNFTYPSQIRNDEIEELTSLIKVFKQYSDMPALMRREFRGEVLCTDGNHNTHWTQIARPIFILIDYKTQKPIMKINPLFKDKMDYTPNDEAIDELISELKLMGINPITPITNVDENEIIDDLREFEMKFEAQLALKQQEWGLDKELMPMLVTKIKTIVKDARYVCKEGGFLRAIMKSVQRIEQSIEQPKKTTWDYMKQKSPYN